MKNKKVCFFVVFFKIFPKFSDFVSSDDCIGKITSKQNLSDYNQFFSSKNDFSSEKMRNSSSRIFDHAHSFFGQDFESNPLY